jgi:glutamyl-tRNA synthetase
LKLLKIFMVEISRDVIVAYALKNSTKHEGKANQGAILAGLFAEGLEKSQIKEIIPLIVEVLDEVNAMSMDEQIQRLDALETKTSEREIREGLKELPNATEGKVVMRLAPFPSGPLHIGNARAAILNWEYVKMYDGKFLLVMDDTIGSEQKQIEPEAYDLIEEGIKWLKIDYGKKPRFKSDRNEIYYSYAEELIKKGYMYVCDCPQEEFAEFKIKGVSCSCRAMNPEAHIKRWKKMQHSDQGSMVVRLKTSMTDPDPAFRDRVMFKISSRKHPRTEDKYKIYPSMEFSWAIDDHLFGVTHVLRGTEHYMSTRVQDFIREIFSWENPVSIYNGHFAIEGVKISKSKGAQEVKSGAYVGWNDPRTWSLQSLRDRGFKSEAIKEFILKLGMKKSSITTPIETLYTINRKLIENSPRYFFIEDPKRITISGAPALRVKIPLHPDGKSGFRECVTSQEFLIPREDYKIIQGGNYRLMHLFNFKADNLERIKTPTYSYISEEPDPDLNVKFIHWIPYDENNFDVDIFMPDGSTISGMGGPELGNLSRSSTIYFERCGYARLHKKEGKKLEFWFAHN